MRRVRTKFGKQGLLFALCLLAACDEKYAFKSDEEIHAEAAALPLEKRYEFYFTVLYNSNVPPSREVRFDIVALGDPAWRYTIQRSSLDSTELEEALHILDAFGRYCTKAEYRTLKANVKRLTYDGTDEQTSLSAEVDHVCGVTSKRHGPEKRLTVGDMIAEKQ